MNFWFSINFPSRVCYSESGYDWKLLRSFFKKTPLKDALFMLFTILWNKNKKNLSWLSANKNIQKYNILKIEKEEEGIFWMFRSCVFGFESILVWDFLNELKSLNLNCFSKNIYLSLQTMAFARELMNFMMRNYLWDKDDFDLLFSLQSQNK